MTSFFKRLLNPSGRSVPATGPARLTLAAFGKHPGWNDHIPGIGVETETLAHVKQALYVSGIGGRIDAGAWKALDAEKRLEGFRHVFLWLRGGHVILGRMHSSEDGLHRKEYPLVLCVDAEGISPEKILARALPELDRLLNACQATASAEQVAVECRMAQDRLRDAFLREAAPAAPSLTLSPGLRQRFVEHRDLGPDRVGLLRSLHELRSAGNRGAGSSLDTRPHHLRLPLAADTSDHALLLWAGFLQEALPAGSPLLLLSRYGTDWIDVVTGEPASDDFFCLQASPKAQPLASEIPYEVSAELRQQLQQLEARFLGPDAALAKPQIAPSAQPAAPPPVTTAQTAPPTRRSFNGLIVLIGIVIVVAAVAGLWLVSGNRGSPPEAKPLTATSPPPAEVQSVVGAPPDDPSKTNADAVAARLNAQPEEKARAEAEARRLAEAKRIADDRVRAAQSTTNRAEDAKAVDEDVDLARLAVARGNYTRALDISRKWPGQGRFKEILAQAAAETNQLYQLTQALQAGNYAPILSRTNPLPDNPKFKEVLAQAEAEAKLLEQARTEFAKADYAFLQRQEVQELKTKPPFQKLLQDGTAEADLLKKAQAFKAENQPQAAHDLIVQNKLNKPPFAEVEKWASVELERNAGQTRDQQQAEAFFKQGDYTRATELCRKYPGVAAFDSLARSINSEQGVLAAAEKKFSEGDYAFLNELAAQGYRTKPPFAELQRRGTAEQTALVELEKLKQTNDWQGAQTALSKLATDVSRKKPFAEVRQWAEAKADADAARKNQDPGWLDGELEKLLVQFNVLKPSDRWLQTAEARKQEPLEPGLLDLKVKEYYLNRVKTLRAEYAQRDWLNQRDRKKYLDRLQSNIEGR